MALNKNIKRLTLICFLIVIVLLILSCEEVIKTPDTIMIGDPSKILINIYDKIIISQVPNERIELNIDVDNDDIDDFKLGSSWSSIVYGTYKRSYIECLNNEASLLYSIDQFDTVFITQEYDTLYNPDIQVHIYEIKACEKADSNYSIFEISKVLSVLQDGDKIRKEDNFLQDQYIFYSLSNTFVMEYYNNDTCVVQHYDPKTCISFPNDKVVYIGIKMATNGDIKLGWIKLNVSGRQIHLIESAIQK